MNNIVSVLIVGLILISSEVSGLSPHTHTTATPNNNTVLKKPVSTSNFANSKVSVTL